MDVIKEYETRWQCGGEFGNSRFENSIIEQQIQSQKWAGYVENARIQAPNARGK